MARPKDLYKCSVALHSGKVLGAEMYQKMTEKYVDCGDGTSYGRGLMILESSAARYICTAARHRGFSRLFSICLRRSCSCPS